MINTKNSRIGKAFVVLSLGLSIAFTATMAVTPQRAHAESASSIGDSYSYSPSPVSNKANSIIQTGQHYIGVRYEHGAPAGNTNTFDCSSFVQYVFGQNGIELPRSSREQSQMGYNVSKSELQPGDLVFSDTNHDGIINHVAIYMGDGKLLHTYRVGIGVTISDFSGSAWDKTFVAARRVL